MNTTTLFNLLQAEFENISCNFCGQSATSVVSNRDRHGFSQKSVICKNCGLIFLNPRMKSEWYDKFYENGFNREMIPLHRKTAPPIPSFEQTFASGEKFGAALAERIRPHVNSGFTVEVGSAAGGILHAFQTKLNLPKILGLDPARGEAEFARAHGVPTEIGLFENFSQNVEPPANILCVQSLNHLLDPKAFLTWSHKTLGKDGHLILVVQNFFSLTKKIGNLQYATQIDHTFMFTPQSLKNYVRSAGFKIIFFENWDDDKMTKLGLSSHHMCLVAEKLEQEPFSKIIIEPNTFDKTYSQLWRIRALHYVSPVRKLLRWVKKIIRRYILRRP